MWLLYRLLYTWTEFPSLSTQAPVPVDTVTLQVAHKLSVCSWHFCRQTVELAQCILKVFKQALEVTATGQSCCAAVHVGQTPGPKESMKCVIPVVCVKIGKGMQSNTTVSHKVYLMAILDNYMFRPILAIFRLSSRELNLRSYYIHWVRTWCRDLYIRTLMLKVILCVEVCCD